MRVARLPLCYTAATDHGPGTQAGEYLSLDSLVEVESVLVYLGPLQGFRHNFTHVSESLTYIPSGLCSGAAWQ